MFILPRLLLELTILIRNPYVQILLLSAKDNTVCLESLQILEGARHVLLLKDFVVGYKTLYGDDTYPLLTEWRTGATLRLFPMIFNHQTHDLMGNIHVCFQIASIMRHSHNISKSPCHAMSVWRNHLFVVFDFSVAIFPQPSFGSLSPFHFDVQSLCFPFPTMFDDSHRVGEAYVYEAGEPLCRNLSNATYQSLRISVRDRYGSLYIRAIEQREDGLFSWDVNLLKESEFDVMSYRHCVGSSSEYQLRLASKSVYGKHPTFLDLIRLPRFESSNSVLGSQFGERQTFVVSARNLPILDLTTAMDFDDAAGVILLGSCRGEISIIQFHDRSSQAPGSLLDNLPSVSFDLPYLQTVRSSHILHCGLLTWKAKAPMPMDLPHCYFVPDKIREGTVPGLVLEESIDRWDNDVAFSKIVPPPGWSSDWKNNRSIQNWVFSFPRWRTLSVDQAFHYDETWTRMLQFRLGNGDIIPIMYHEDNHDFVIFRIANRVYHFLRGPPLDEDLHRIMALPFSAQDLSSPNSLTHLWNERWRNGPLCNHSEDSPALSFLRRTEECLTVLDYLKTDSGRQQLTELSLSDDMRTWSLDDRRKMYMEANRRRWDAHKSMNSPQDDF